MDVYFSQVTLWQRQHREHPWYDLQFFLSFTANMQPINCNGRMLAMFFTLYRSQTISQFSNHLMIERPQFELSNSRINLSSNLLYAMSAKIACKIQQGWGGIPIQLLSQSPRGNRQRKERMGGNKIASEGRATLEAKCPQDRLLKTLSLAICPVLVYPSLLSTGESWQKPRFRQVAEKPVS